MVLKDCVDLTASTPGPQKHKAWVDIRPQCTHHVMSSGYSEEEPAIFLEQYQEFVLEAEVSLNGDQQQKYPVVTNTEIQCFRGIDYCSRKYSMAQKGTDGFFWYIHHEQREN